MNSFYVVFAVMAAAVAFADGKAAIQEVDFVKWYSCAGKPAGNYRHPWNCNRFMSCSEGGIASERQCAACAPYPGEMCPEQWTRWDDNLGRCEWASTTPCDIDEFPTEEPPTETDAPTDPPATEAPGDECDPEICMEEGYCLNYRWCDPQTRKWVEEQCDEGYVWVPNGQSGVHGGACGQFSSLDPATRDQYWKDRECMACGWWSGECSGAYQYRRPHQTNPDKMTLNCDGPLLWDQATLTCRECQNVRDSEGNVCCGAIF